MTPTIQSLGIDRLTRDQRIALVQEIWNTIAAEAPPPLLADPLRDELRRRVADDDANPDDVVSWDIVKATTLARLKR